VLDVGAGDTVRAVRAQGKLLTAAVLEGVQLLVGDIGALGAGAQEDADLLEDGRLDFAVAVRLGDSRCGLLDPAPVGLVGGETVGGASGRFVGRHREIESTRRVKLVSTGWATDFRSGA